MVKTSEDLSLLLNYISVIGIWFAIPSVSLLLNRDKRWKYAIIILSILILLLIISYILEWHVLFPKPSDELYNDKKEKYTLADYDKIKQCRCNKYKFL